MAGLGGMYGGMVQPPHGQPAGVPQQGGMPQQNKPQQNMPQQGMSQQQQQQQNILQQQRMSQNMAQVGMQQTVLPQLSHLQQGGAGTTSISTPIGIHFAKRMLFKSIVDARFRNSFRCPLGLF